MIKFESVSKNYFKDIRVLNDLNYSLESGEFNFLLGLPLSGKRTFFDLILGIEKPTHGCVTHDFNYEVLKKAISIVFPNNFFKDSWKLEKIVEKHLKKLKMKNQPSHFDLFSTLNLPLEKRVSDCSKKELDYFKFVLSLLKNPELILFYDCFKSFNKEDFAKLKEILQINSIGGIYTTEKTHQIDNDDVVAILSNGQIERKDTFEKINENPLTTLVALNFTRWKENVFAFENKTGYIKGENISLKENGDFKIVATEGGKLILESDTQTFSVPKNTFNTSLTYEVQLDPTKIITLNEESYSKK